MHSKPGGKSQSSIPLLALKNLALERLHVYNSVGESPSLLLSAFERSWLNLRAVADGLLRQLLSQSIRHFLTIVGFARFVNTHTHTNTNTNTQTRTHVRTRARTSARACARTRTHACLSKPRSGRPICKGLGMTYQKCSRTCQKHAKQQGYRKNTCHCTEKLKLSKRSCQSVLPLLHLC